MTQKTHVGTNIITKISILICLVILISPVYGYTLENSMFLNGTTEGYDYYVEDFSINNWTTINTTTSSKIVRMMWNGDLYVDDPEANRGSYTRPHNDVVNDTYIWQSGVKKGNATISWHFGNNYLNYTNPVQVTIVINDLTLAGGGEKSLHLGRTSGSYDLTNYMCGNYYGCDVTTNLSLYYDFSGEYPETHSDWAWIYKVNGGHSPIGTYDSFSGVAINATVTADPLNGSTPLIDQFNSTTPGEPTNWSWLFGDETERGWTQINTAAGMAARYRMTIVSTSDSDLFMLGGDDIWRSTDRGITWVKRNSSYSGYTMGDFISGNVLNDDSLIIMGYNKTWRSTDEGTTWVLINNGTSGLGNFYGHSSAVLPNGHIVLFGGRESSTLLDDTWISTTSGVNWSIRNISSAIPATEGSVMFSLSDGSLVVTGGNITDYPYTLKSVWRSTDEGLTWHMINASVPWDQVAFPAGVVLSDDTIEIIGGSAGGDARGNETWMSQDKGYTWTKTNLLTTFTEARGYMGMTALYDDAVVMIGGKTSASRTTSTGGLTDVWIEAYKPSSYDPNPSHTYTLGGIYNVSLTITNPTEIYRVFKPLYITAIPGIITANFNANRTSALLPATIRFVDASSNDPTSWDWDFGDGSPHNYEQNPAHTYGAAGLYTVIMTATNNESSDTITKLNYMQITAPIADFTANITSGIYPTAIQFNDTSEGTPNAWYWNFGDGSTIITIQNPVHVYALNGSYTVTLIVATDGASYTQTKTDYIIITAATPSTQFLAVPQEGLHPLTVQFYDQSTNTPTSWDWDFGDGTAHSTEQNPEHTYADENMYTPTLVATNGYGSTPMSKVNYIDVTAPEGMVMTRPTQVNTTTWCVEFNGRNLGDPSTVWFEYGMIQDYTNGYKSFKTKNQTGVVGNFSYTQCGIPILPGESYKVHAGGEILGAYVYGMNRTFLLPKTQPHTTTTYSVQVNKFVQDGLDPVSLLTYDIWQPYLGLMGGLFFAILVAFIFMNVVIKQRTVSLTIIVLLLTGTVVWRLLPPAFIKIAQMLFIAGVAGLLYWLFMKRR